MTAESKKFEISKEYLQKIGARVVEAAEQIQKGNQGITIMEFVLGVLARYKNEKDEIILSNNFIRIATTMNPGTPSEDFLVIPLEFAQQPKPLVIPPAPAPTTVPVSTDQGVSDVSQTQAPTVPQAPPIPVTPDATPTAPVPQSPDAPTPK